MDLNPIKAIIFDLEGTLLDRKKSRDKFIEEQYERFHDYLVRVQASDYRKKFIELDDDEDHDKPDLYKEIIKQFNIDRLSWKDLFHDFEMHFYRYVFPFYDTHYTLQKLTEAGYKIGVIANGKSNIKHYRIYALGIEDYVNHLSTSETVGFRKPHPRIYEDILEKLNVAPSEVIYVGDDALNDVAPARAMGMVSIWYRHKEGDVKLEPLASEMDFEISTLEELLEILDISKGEEK
ncbi:HAD family hydrolase [Staphylococcus chromogenes]|uniref:HAD family hydrolase n=1 Tax=Staphylococcus chromogenes TaxID=46126 RepID=A0ABD5AWQ5_STACR|nr:HAD family hydrolase [Staphylococcus chromogenes]MCE4970542.1 HAD family hydrolase [Staphylococcus chromogenes]MCE5004829.1 HAD family hydrolase [Staphylococcus chromogenes]MCE5091994.1 HAD family hydrolase [Staphylococcus chromogenes]MDQ7175952.1 HAD family hydrolase [Staphylococcus chromogenes]MDT0671681.1 HAD family hydrolase [Staphylococcus chromogenes]